MTAAIPRLDRRGFSSSVTPDGGRIRMTQTLNRVTIRAPRERVFAVAEDKARFPDFMPHVLESRETRDGGLVVFRMAARMRFGFVSRWASERVADEPGRWAAYRTEGFCRRMEGRWTAEELEPDALDADRRLWILRTDTADGDHSGVDVADAAHERHLPHGGHACRRLCSDRNHPDIQEPRRPLFSILQRIPAWPPPVSVRVLWSE